MKSKMNGAMNLNKNIEVKKKPKKKKFMNSKDEVLMDEDDPEVQKLRKQTLDKVDDMVKKELEVFDPDVEADEDDEMGPGARSQSDFELAPGQDSRAEGQAEEEKSGEDFDDGTLPTNVKSMLVYALQHLLKKA